MLDSPQHNSSACSFSILVTLAGYAKSFPDFKPSCPCSLLPQVYTVPLLSIAEENRDPAPIATILHFPKVFTSSNSKCAGSFFPRPNCPCCPHPVEYTLPFWLNIRECASPLDALRTLS
eukprot:TRINITY_DN19678_c0_g1_i1.p2 TRINITY_DN19678_c0_g1~~TRINITY_DN19678_c0_g1_i1.p2  ORF type:complete len:119 (-),score=12.17 TRINITY_DN19678_c0_g1_i1:237-593(-)